MALVIPMLMALIFITFEGANFLYVEHQLVKGVRDGARYGARQPFSKFTCSTVDATTASNIIEVARTGQVSGGTPRVAAWTSVPVTTTVTASCPATAVTTGIYASMANAPRVTVKAVVPYTSFFGLLSGMTSLKVAAQDQAAVMGI
ncbi:MAG: pilus assembly protein [Proteobacteria bacterium]|nr:pilus assembly protein [Pseudomonadota bacterium]